jgi:predicted ATP-grasp superfamily ATP-dependent carboligase
MKVLATDADDKKTLAAVRYLGREGAEVWAGGVKRWEQSFFSKHCSGMVLYPNPVRDAEAFAQFLLDYLAEHPFDCVLPMSDYTTIPISRRKSDFAAVTHVAVPDYEALCRLRDKVTVTRLARTLGIGAPETYCPSNLEEVASLSGRIAYPCVIKYRRGSGSIGLRYADSREEMLSLYRGGEHKSDVVFDDVFPIVQELIPGEIRDVSALFREGEPRAAVVTRRVKTLPARGGDSAVVETVRDDALTEQAFRLLAAAKWHGPAQVEFKMDPRDGVAKIMEVNTRFWGGLAAAAEAGVNFAHLACRLALEGDIEPVRDYRVGLVYRWPIPMELAAVFDSRDRLAAALDFLTLKRGVRCDISPRDPAPHAVKAGVAMYRWVRGRRRRRGAR